MVDLATREYTAGLHQVADGAYAWLAPDGSWGWSNAGLVVDGEAAVLVDTLFDLELTAAMLARMADAEPAAAGRFEYLVNTHANGDHCHGNELVDAAEIITSTATASEMAELPPGALALMMESVDDTTPLGRYLTHAFGAFDFSGITATPPTRTFDRELDITVGDKLVRLHEVGPAHTRGDVLVEVPADRVVYTGDILFIDGTPIMWTGPVDNWIVACERIEAMDVDLIVPGHGPITDRAGAAAVRGYLGWLRDEARARHAAGMGVIEAARDIGYGEYDSWSDRERLVVNVNTVYRELGSDDVVDDVMGLFAAMAELAGS